MSIDERELRSRLAEAAALAGPPRLATEDLAARVRRIRRRRRRRAGIIAAVSVAAVASTSAIPLTRGGTSQPGISAPAPTFSLHTLGGRSQPGISVPAPASPTPTPGGTSQSREREALPVFPPPGLSYTVTANGQTPVTRGALPLFSITPGEKLTITVDLTLPAHVTVTALWLGITNGVLAPVDMKPVLASSTRVPLQPGVHRFVLHWSVPAGFRPGTSRQLSAEWAWPGPVPGEVEGEVADLAVPR